METAERLGVRGLLPVTHSRGPLRDSGGTPVKWLRIGSAAASDRISIFAENPDYAALDLHVGSRDDNRVHLAVGGLKANLAARLAIETLQGGVGAADQGDHNFAGIGDLGLLDDDVVSIEDVIVPHGATLHLKDIAVATADEFAERKCFAFFDGFERAPRGNAAHHGDFDGLPIGNLFANRLGKVLHFNGAALVVTPPDVALLLESGDVLVDGCQRVEFQMLGDFLKAGRIAVLVQEADQQVEHFLLPFGESHLVVASEN